MFEGTPDNQRAFLRFGFKTHFRVGSGKGTRNKVRHFAFLFSSQKRLSVLCFQLLTSKQLQAGG